LIDSLTLPRILEATFGLLGAAVGVVILLFALRTATTLTLLSHRRALRIFVVIALLIVVSELIGVLGPFVRASAFTDVAEELAELVAISCGGFILYLISRAEQEEVSVLRHSANVDELTDLSSRSFFRRAADRRHEMSKRNDLPLSCVVLDVDDFKPYNDRYGHKAGDEALRCVARVLRESARADDLVARYGGEEFVLLMSGGVEDALEVAERIRLRVQDECTPEYDASLSRPVTLSLGIAALTKDTPTFHAID
jgi:two-component system, sensor histidine kinase LadS